MQSNEQLLREALEGLIAAYERAGPDLARAERAVDRMRLIEAQQALASSRDHQVDFITPLMEQQMFDDWCPYKGNPDPRVVWAAAIEAVNGLLLGANNSPVAQFCKAVEDIKETSKKLYTEEELRLSLEGAREQFAKRLEQIKEQIIEVAKDLHYEGWYHASPGQKCPRVEDTPEYKKLLDILNSF
jgi:hypothetical protein